MRICWKSQDLFIQNYRSFRFFSAYCFLMKYFTKNLYNLVVLFYYLLAYFYIWHVVKITMKRLYRMHQRKLRIGLQTFLPIWGWQLEKKEANGFAESDKCYYNTVNFAENAKLLLKSNNQNVPISETVGNLQNISPNISVEKCLFFSNKTALHRIITALWHNGCITIRTTVS